MKVGQWVGRLAASLLVFSMLSFPEVEARNRVSHVISNRQQHKSQRHFSSNSRRQSNSRRARKSRRDPVVRARPQQEVGVLVLTESGETLVDRLSSMEFNPASAIKIITTYGALTTFGPDHRFTTDLYLDGTMDSGTGIFKGDLYLKGCDPDFEHKDAAELARGLSEAGIKQIDGKLIVEPNFSYRSSPNALASANSLLKIWRGHKVSVRNGAAVGKVSDTAQSAGQFESEPLRDTLKRMMSYSLNGVAEQIGRTVGGVRRLEEIVSREAGLNPGTLKLASASGLGKSRVKPRDMMLILKSLRTRLQSAGMDYQDIFPVAGIDRGTMDERFTAPTERGSVVAKTGTLPGTDGGTSALVGMFRSQQEDCYFVIFCWKGSVSSFRQQQDNMIRQLQAQRGGPKPFEYNKMQPGGPTALD